MIGTLLRVLIGFVLAAVAAGLVLVLHADPPSDILARSGGGLDGNVLMPVGELALKTGTHIAIFAAPFALIVAALGEWQGARGIWLYLLAGLAIAAGGFTAQHVSEVAGQSTVLNDYAARAFALAGAVAGAVYWLAAGRLAGAPGAATAEELTASERHEVPKKDRTIVDAEVATAKPGKPSGASPSPAAASPAATAAAKPEAAKPKPIGPEAGKPEPAKPEPVKPAAEAAAAKAPAAGAGKDAASEPGKKS